MRTIFVNPSRPKSKNAPRPWASLYAQKYGSLAKRRKHKRKSKSAPSSKMARRKKSKYLKDHVVLTKRELKSMLLNRNPRRSRRARKTTRRSRRRNAGITPFIQANPRGRSLVRRRRRRNPDFSGLSINRIVSKSLTYGSGAGLGVATNIFALNKIPNPWLRNGARIFAGCIGAPMLKGELGAAAAGALFAPLVTELAVMLHLPGIATEADLEADLQDLLDDMSPDPDANNGRMRVDADLW